MPSFHKDTTGAEVVTTFAAQTAGKTFVITGPSANSLGAQTILDLATGNPAHLLLVGRNESKIAPVMAEVALRNPSIKTSFIQADLDSLASVRQAAANIAATVPDKIDVLVNNAGIMVAEYSKTKDGFESQFGVNHLAHFLLTNLLLEAGKLRDGSRVLNVSSMGCFLEGLREDWNFSDGKTFNVWRAYGQSKACNALFSVALTEKAKSKGVLAFTVDPGFVGETNLQNGFPHEVLMEGFQMNIDLNGKEFSEWSNVPKSLAAGPSTCLFGALSPDLDGASGAFLKDANILDHGILKDHLKNPEAAQRLWKLSEELVGQTFEY